MKKENINVLVACEESQRVATEFRKLGFNAYSCDIQECSGEHPEFHICGDVLPLINGGEYNFRTQDGKEHFINKWDLIIAHPPCTYLAVSGNRWYNVKQYGEKAVQRGKDREFAVDFFMQFINADCDCIAVENPVGIMSTRYQKPTQIIQPWQYGDNVRKKTCLWLKNLPQLVPQITDEPEIDYYYWVDNLGKLRSECKWNRDILKRAKTQDEVSRHRSKTFMGIAKAMAGQWGAYLEKKFEND